MYTVPKLANIIALFPAVLAWQVILALPAVAQGTTTVLPTDITPIRGTAQSRLSNRNLQWHLWKNLPAPLYFNAQAESSLRLETNPFQFPLKRTFLKHEIPPGTNYSTVPSDEKDVINEGLSHVADTDNVYRINPSATVGWALTSNTQVYANYFFLRDSLFNSSSLNSNTQAIGFGIQRNVTITDKLSLQPQMFARELYQTAEPNVFDYLPNCTMQYQMTPNLILYQNTLMQIRMKHFAFGPGRELNPFYTIGFAYQRGRWALNGSATYLENYRKLFGPNAIIPNDNKSVVCDLELDRQVFASMPALQAFVRLEPVYNFASHAVPGLAGMDMRIYYGLRYSIAKPALNGTMQQLINRYTSN